MRIRVALASASAVLSAVVIVSFTTRSPESEAPRRAEVDPRKVDVEREDAALVSAPEDSAADTVRRSTVADEVPALAPATAGTRVLRVVLEGIPEEDARQARVTLTGVDENRDEWPAEIQDSWPCEGSTSDFDLDPFLASVQRFGDLRVDELEVEVDSPHYLSGSTRVPLSDGTELEDGKIVHEARVRLVRPVYWPELTLTVRDANTRAHLEGVELSIMRGAWTAYWGSNPRSHSLGEGLKSPIAMMGGRDADQSTVTVAGVALSPAAGESARFVELERWFAPERGVIVIARAPGYAQSSTVIDVSKGGEHELLLEPGSTLDVRLTNVQLAHYAALETVAMLCVYWIREDGGNQYVRFEPLDETLETEGLRLDCLDPGGYRVTVELGGGSWPKHPEIAREEVSLDAGDTRELVLVLGVPPALPERATLGGVVSFPAFGGEDEVRLELYEAAKRDVFVGARASYQPDPDVELVLADMERAGGSLPTWSFRVEDLPVGLYQIQLWPFLESWMIELPPGGRDDVALAIPELAEVLVETVDARTGERIPLEQLYYRHEEDLATRVQIDRRRADLEEPGLFRFWGAPGPALLYPYGIPSELNYGARYLDLELVGGLQSVRFELEPVYALRLELRDGGAALSRFDGLWAEMYTAVSETMRAVDHEGRMTKILGVGTNREVMLVEVSAPGVYEVHFEGVGADRFRPIPPQLVAVHADATAEVIVELQRK